MVELNHRKDKGIPKTIYTGTKVNEWIVGEYIVEKGITSYKCTCEVCDLHRTIRGSNIKSGKTAKCKHKETSKAIVNPVGMHFNDWEVIEKLGDGNVTVQCSCGFVRDIHIRYLRDGTSKSCGHDKTGITSKLIDITGETYGQWYVDCYYKDKLWVCKCIKCGREKLIRGHLIRQKNQECLCDVQERLAQENLDKYGVRSIKQLNSSRTLEQIQMYDTRERLIKTIEETHNMIADRPTISEIANKIGIDSPSVLRYIRKYSLEEMVRIGIHRSIYEAEIQELFPTKHISDRSVLGGKELDLYYPESKAAIEINGNYWHCELQKDSKYHQRKTIDSAKKGIQLFHVYEYEWLDPIKKKKIIDILGRKINESKSIRIYARNCLVKEIQAPESNEFLDKYHLQGGASSEIKLGMFKDNELIGVMTFGKPRFNREYQYEIIRLAWKTEVTVIGGAEKIFEYFKRKYTPKSVLTYVDIGKFTGNIYTKLGFKFNGFTDPNYKWVNIVNNEVLTRYQTQKHLLIEKGLGKFGDTEVEIMQNLVFYRIYDSGNLRLTWEKDK